MRQPTQISPQAPTARSMDYAELRARGLELCQALASDLWTDYNEHDPGVTILEQLCYALTDLGYRTNFPVEDILASRPADSKRPALDADTLFTGDRILTCSPLTVEDYRRLLYAETTWVRNVWLQPVTDHPLGIQGLYKVLVETYGCTSEQKDKVRDFVHRSVEKQMRSHRNLGEDVDSIEVLNPFPLHVSATLVTSAGSNPADVLARALFAVQEGLVPHPRLVPIADSFASNIPPDEIFVGPLLSCGGMESDGDGALPAEIAVKRVRQLLASVRGVRDVKALSVNGMVEGSARLAPGSVARLEPSIYEPQPEYPIRVETSGGEHQAVDAYAVHRLIQLQIAENKNRETYAFQQMRESQYIQRPRGQDRSIDHYYSIQHQFPATYGVGRLGISERFGESELLTGALSQREAERDAAQRRIRRLAQSRQLKAYLMFFEQLLADHLAQLAHAGDLFALDSTLDRSYFAQPLVHDPALEDDPPDGADVLIAGPEPKAAQEPFHVCIVDDRRGADTEPSEILLMSRAVTSSDEAWRVLDEIFRLGVAAEHAAEHYATETSHHGDVRLLLPGSADRPLAHGEERFTSLERAREGQGYLQNFLSRLKADPALRERYIKHVSPPRPFGVRVVDEIGRVLLSSYDVPTLDARRRREDQILDHGVHPERYRLKEHVSGELSVLLCDAEHRRIIAFGGRRFASREEASREIRELERRLRAIGHDEALRSRHLQRLPEASVVQPRESSVVQPKDGPSTDARARQLKMQAYRQGLERIVADPGAPFLHRRNRFLDHLLARFGERFENAALASFDPRPYGERDAFYRELVEWKLDYLRDYVQLSAQRGMGFDYGRATPAQPQENLSGLERRLHLLLGLQGHSDAAKGVSARRPLTSDEPAHAHIEAGVEIDAAPLFHEHVEGTLLLSSIDPAVLQALLRHGARREHFAVERRSEGGLWHVHFHGPGGTRHEVYRAGRETHAWEAVDRLLHDLHDYGKHGEGPHAGEGLYVLEHVLLRPTTAVLPLAAVDKNYRVELAPAPDEVGRTWRLLLCRSDPARTPIAQYRHLFYTSEEADQWGRHLALQIQKAKAQPAHFTRYLHLFNRVGGASHEEDTFYSHRISVFFSAWPIRARHRGFQELAEELVHANCPAHIAAQCFWLGYRDMHDFETLHAAWMKEKAATHNDGRPQELDLLAGGLKHFIEWLRATPEEPARRERTGMPPDLATLIRHLEQNRRRPSTG